MTLLAINSGVPRRRKWSGIETAADALPVSSVPHWFHGRPTDLKEALRRSLKDT
jgi:hypothetical protein